MGRVNLIQAPWWSADAVTLSTMSTSLIDGTLEVTGEQKAVLRQRPGLLEQCNPGTNKGGQGCYYSQLLDILLFVSDGKLWKYEQDNITVELVSSDFHATNTVIFAEGQDLDSTPVIYMADSTQLKYYKNGSVTVVTDPAAPQTASYVCWFNNRFLANDSGLFFSATGVNPATNEFDNYYWGGAFNPFIAEYKADNLDFIGALSGALWCWGKESLELWNDDGVTPLVPVPSYSSEIGLVAKYSPVAIGDNWFALIKTQGQIKVGAFMSSQPTIISDAISKQLNSYSVLEDAVGFYIFTGGFSYYVLTFPTEGVTWAFDLQSKYWAKWAKWNSTSGTYDQYIGIYSTYAEKWGKFFVQSRNDSRIYSVNRDYFTDSGYPIRMEYTSGNIDHGSSVRKRSDKIMFHVKAVVNQDSQFQFRIRDDGNVNWSSYIPVGLSFQQQNLSTEQINRMGIYRTRQYQIVMSDPVGLALCDFEEDIKVLRD